MIYLLYSVITMNNSLRLTTYNSHGTGPGRLPYIASLCKEYDFVLTQEHWLFNDQISLFSDYIQNISVHGVSGMDDKELLAGRPYGGCAILWNRSLTHKVTPVDCPASNRMCAVIVQISDLSILLCNVYMPVDSTGATEEYKDILCQVAAISSSRGIDHIVLGGDFNTDPERHDSAQTRALTQFMNSEGLVNGVSHPCSRVDYTFESKATGTRSTIDHFVLSENLHSKIQMYSVLHEGDNLSDHSPVVLSLSLPVMYAWHRTNGTDKQHRPRTNWKTATDQDVQEYGRVLDLTLSSIAVPWEAIQCTDYYCTMHNTSLENFHNDIVNACLLSSERTIPATSKMSKGGPKPGGLLGWNEHVEDLRQRAILWHIIWKDNGSPRHGLLADIRRRTRSRYHHAVRFVKRQKERLSADRLAESMGSNGNDFWSEIRRLQGSSTCSPCTIDGAEGPDDIAKVFSEKFEAVYNSVGYSDSDMDTLMSDIRKAMHSGCDVGRCYSCHVISVEDVDKAVHHLKPGKSDGHTGHSTDHLLHGTPKLRAMISLQFSSMLSHGFSPHSFLQSSIKPIPKNKRKSLNDSENYRGIALSSILAKVFDWIVLEYHRDILASSDLQFGFKPKHSTTQCTFVVNETIQYYLNNGGNVYALLLDASKAFDKVNYVKLFRLLINRGLCPLLCRLLLVTYTSQIITVNWHGTVSQEFTTANGVKQGGVLSPILFAVYIDVLLERLAACGVGCYIGRRFMGAFSFADDISLLAPTVAAATRLLQVADEFSKEYDVTFNAGKSKLLVFGPLGGAVQVYHKGVLIPYVTEDKHLGNPFGQNSPIDAIKTGTEDMIKRANALHAKFHFASWDVKYLLFKTFCTAWYGSQLWDVNERSTAPLCVEWRKVVRKLLQIPRATHSALVHLICDDFRPDVQLHTRCMKFIVDILNSPNAVVFLCAQLAASGSRSTVADNMTYLCSKYNLSRSELTNNPCWGHFRGCMRAMATQMDKRQDIDHANVIREMMALRTQPSELFTSHEAELIIQNLCVL